ncbi:DUF1189 domain-containing protein [Peribacillus kribbensis]|uniref:DUF1189 domain-containing protein n=1 Tax=Peribacillus kribbensis TaxID=356658 RepID=UPI00041DEC43|nr:DUF1189 domain-containing protein [Peribacillus kribbensis]
MNIFVQFYKSLYSPKDIARFRFQGIGKTILYLFMLSLISVLPSLIYVNMEITAGVKAAKSTMNKDLPDFEIKDGVLTTKSSVPFLMKKDGFNIYLDSSGAVTEREVTNRGGSAIALLKDKMVFTAGGNTGSYEYSMARGMHITNKTALDALNKIQSLYFIILPALSLTIYCTAAASLFFQATIIALVGLFLASRMERRLQYRHLWRLTAYSLTLATVFFTIMGFLQTNVVYKPFINWLVTLIILYLSIKEVPLPKQKPRD